MPPMPSQQQPRIPADGSLRQLLIQNNRSRLWVYPNQWTEQHLDLLRVRVSPGYQESQDPPTVVYNALRSILLPGKIAAYDRVLAAKTWMEEKFTLLFFYAKKAKVCLEVDFMVCEDVTGAPVLGFDSGEPSDEQLKRWALENSFPDINPYDVSTLIAMAQEMRSSLDSVEGITGCAVVYLLVPNPDKCSFYLFSASVPYEYLNALDDPYSPFKWDMHIERESVTFEGLTEVLKRVLRKHPLITGEFKVVEMSQESVGGMRLAKGKARSFEDHTVHLSEEDFDETEYKLEQRVCKLREEALGLAEVICKLQMLTEGSVAPPPSPSSESMGSQPSSPADSTSAHPPTPPSALRKRPRITEESS